MADTDRKYGYRLSHPPEGERVVISGLAGKYPDADNTRIFQQCLFDKVDLVSDDTRRWIKFHDEIPQRTGKLNDINKVDAGFFGLTQRYANYMDPMIRLVLEKSVEAVMDAGVNPTDLEGTKTGMYVGICCSETERKMFYDQNIENSGGVTGCLRSMAAQRVSYFLKLDGQSFTSDTACSSSAYALNIAYENIRNGLCEQAIVAGVNLCLFPQLSLQFSRLGMLSMEGVCRAFDENASGYVRSEAVTAIFLQKERHSRRVYARIIHSKLNCDGYKTEGITFPASEVQKILLKEFYEECEVPPSTISYVEAHGTGTKVGDPEELQAIDEIFCKDRDGPLLIGTVKSNIGHTEPCSFLCSITKVIFALETGMIPPNINFKTPRLDVEALQVGRMRVVTEPTKWDNPNGLIAVNNFGFGGANGHILLQRHDKIKIRNEHELPRLICVSGRTEESIFSYLDEFKNEQHDFEYVRLFHEVFSKALPNEKYRGFSIVSKDGELNRSVNSYFKKKKLGFVFTFNDDDLVEFIKDLCKIEIFRQSLTRVQTIVNSIENIGLLQNTNNYVQKCLTHVALWFGLLQILNNLEIYPDYYSGCFIGQLFCAYLENLLNLRDIVKITILVGKAMTKKFTNNNPPLSLNQTLTKLMPFKTAKSEKWKQSNENDKNQELTTLITNDLTNPKLNVDFTKMFPKDTITFDFANAIRSKNSNNTIVNLLNNLGTLYQFGFNAKLDRLYPSIEWPVSRTTPMLSPLVKWDHSRDYSVVADSSLGSRKYDRYVINEKYNDWSYISGHMINEKKLFPASGYLYIVKESFGKLSWVSSKQLNICFENVKFIRATYVPSKTSILFDVNIEVDGYFYIWDKDGIVVTGRIYEIENPSEELIDIDHGNDDESLLKLNSKDIYKELKLRGYNYRGMFRGILECNNLATKGVVKWEDNWITFLDTLMQFQILQVDTRNLYVPTSVYQIIIHSEKHYNSIKNNTVEVRVDRSSRTVRTEGVQLREVGCTAISKRKPLSEPVIESYQFLANETVLSVKDSVRANVQIILENNLQHEFKVFEINFDEDSEPLCEFIQKALEDQPLIQADIKLHTSKQFDYPGVTAADKTISSETNILLAVGKNLLSNPEELEMILKSLDPKGYVLTRENDFDGDFKGLIPLTIHKTERETLILLKKPSNNESKMIVIQNELDFVKELQQELNVDQNLTIVSTQKNCAGFLGFVNCLRREPGNSNIRCVFVMDDVQLDLEDIRNQLKKEMAVNVFKDSHWGTYRHLITEEFTVKKVKHIHAVVEVPGDLSSLTWIEGPLSSNTIPNDDQVLIHIYYASLNFRDILTASGRLPPDTGVTTRLSRMAIQGLEFAGRDSNGKRFMGMTHHGALSSHFLANKFTLWEIPEEYSMEEAATLPTVYLTVLRAFETAGGLKEGKKILIHSGSGGVGQAAINIALYYKCVVFTTVGTPEKREFLLKQFPQINPENIGNSRDTSFEDMIRKQTNGQGVDIVLNSLTGEKLFASLRCISKGGHMLEIGKFDLVNDNELSLYAFERQINIHGIMLDLAYTLSLGAYFHKLFLDASKLGIIKPLVRTVFDKEKIEDAFRYMSSGKHIGKVVIRIRPEENTVTVPRPMLFEAKAKFYCDENASYVIVGGLGGFGMELADWLVTKGCKKLVLVSRNGLKTGYQDLRIRFWKKYVDTVEISTDDVTTRDGCVNVMNKANSLGPVDAIFNLAVVLKDGLFNNLTVEEFESSLAPKAIATKHLDEVTRELCPKLKYFVVFSSVSCGRGNPGQTNYGMSNSVMERICERRKADGLHALAIQWGAIGDVGLVADMNEMNRDVVIGGTLQQRISNCLQLVDDFLRHDATIISSMVVAEKRTGANVEEVICNILGIKNTKAINVQMTLAELGMDSITGAEIKQIIERDFDIILTPQEMKTMTFLKIRELSEKKGTKTQSTTAETIQPADWLNMILRNMKETDFYDVPRVELTTINPLDTREVYFLPGVEGMGSVFTPLASMLNCKAVACQFLFSYKNDTLESVAREVYNHVPKSGNVKLVSYSYGCLVAVELIDLIEASGGTVDAIFIDGAPMYFKKMFEKAFGDGKGYLKTTLLIEIVSFLAPSVAMASAVKSEILKHSTFDEQLNAALMYVSNQKDFSNEYLEKSFYTIYDRLLSLKNYSMTKKELKARVKLYRPNNAELINDYGLSDYFVNAVDVQIIDGEDHVSILQNTEVINGINDWIKLN